MKELKMVVLVLGFLGLMSALSSEAGTDMHKVRGLAARDNVTCILVFGDSSVDPGNNDYFPTPVKGNFPPYGRDFFSGRPTGRFTNGRLATDFICTAPCSGIYYNLFECIYKNVSHDS